ncbi:MAG TPA: TlpA disulfide reductase family protein [Chitinophagales bacterium]|nr:TlpA disulfide reductase family protein [Chitinophagales bacterium]
MKANRIISIVTILVLLFIAGFLYTKYRVAPAVNFPKLHLTHLNGAPYPADSLTQKAVINFFATWCAPCMKEMPGLAVAQSKLAADGFVFVCISDEAPARLQALASRFPGLLVLHSEIPLQDLKIYTIPTTYVLNNSGKPVMEKTGELNWEDDTMLDKLKGLAK